MRPAAVSLLLGVAVLVWPVRDRIGRAATVLGAVRHGAEQRQGTGPGGRAGESVVGPAPESLLGMWHQDPLEIYRRWRLRRRPDDVIAAALALLDATEPALAAGLPPATAISLAVEAVEAGDHEAGGVERGSGVPEAGGPESRAGAEASISVREVPRGSLADDTAHVRNGAAGSPPTTARRLGADLAESARQGSSVAAVWAAYADRTGSKDLAFVAAAWRLSEETGVPLAVAVARAAAGLREARTRQRKVAVAVAGPKATVAVLTVLPLTGPLFGVACGVGPAELYGGRPIGAASAAGGVLLMVVGRLWCRRMIRRAVTP